MNPDFKFNIEKDHLTVYTKVKMAQEVFDFFDLDKDGYWNYAESYECHQPYASGAVLSKRTGGLQVTTAESWRE